MTTVAGISDYKGVLEDLSNGIAPSYFGVRGQEVGQEQVDAGTPRGVYVTESVTDSPAYNAGIQNGDIITAIGEAAINNVKDLQNQIEMLNAGDRVRVTVQRNGTEVYRELEFEVEIGAR